MNLFELKMDKYIEDLKSDKPAPGGGATSAISSAQGIALTMMVANLTVGKEKFEIFEKVNREVLEHGEEALKSLKHLANEDADAFNRVFKAYKLSKETEEEKKARSKAIVSATEHATEVPIKVMEASMEALKLTAALVGRSNPNILSDLGAASMCLETGIRNAWLNVKINLPALKNKEKEDELREKGEEIYNEGIIIAEKIYSQVLESIN